MYGILEKIKEREQRTGLSIKQNPFSLGASVIITETGETVYNGEDVGCMLFIMKVDELLQRDQNVQVSDTTEAK